MIRDVVYTEAGDARRRLFHRRALDLLVAAKASPAVLAHHALAAGLTEAAFEHTLAAGMEALRLSAAGEAVVHLEIARQLAREIPLAGPAAEAQRRDLYQQLGQAYELSGNTDEGGGRVCGNEEVCAKLVLARRRHPPCDAVETLPPYTGTIRGLGQARLVAWAERGRFGLTTGPGCQPVGGYRSRQRRQLP